MYRRHPKLGFHYALYVTLLVATILVLSLFASLLLRSFAFDAASDALLVTAAMARNVLDPGEILRPEIAASYCTRAALETGVRVTIVRSDGLVLGDSAADPGAMDDHAKRPEVRQALSGEPGSSIRYSNTVRLHMVYVALPVTDAAGAIVAVLRLSRAVTEVRTVVGRLSRRLAIVGLLVVAAALIAARTMSRTVRGSIRTIVDATSRYSAGDLSHRFAPDGPAEMVELGEEIQSMAAELDERIREVSRQRSEIETIVNSVQDPIIVIDGSMRVQWMNTAAVLLAELPSSDLPVPAYLLGLFHCSELHQASLALFRTGKPVRRMVHYYADRDFEFEFFGRSLPNGSEAIIVLHDLSREKRVERIRKDFVANVSHELKTPLTLIKGASSTLRDIIPPESIDAADFAAMIETHADRIMRIIEDLLSLARIEATGQTALPRSTTRIRDLISSSAELAGVIGDGVVTIECDSGLEYLVNQPLLTHAVTNLIANAITYTERDPRIVVSVRSDDDELVIAVADNGVGIPFADQDRVFERFYRVEKGRSRETGGTGLGLAIVKHAAIAHGGRVDLESVPGRGSTFIITIPARADRSEESSP